MTKRREFSRTVKVEIIKRATRDNGHGKPEVFCEGCGLATTRYDIDHTNPDALQIDKSKLLTAADGKLLCAGSRDTCHGRKTAEQDQPKIAKAKRREAGHMRADRRQTGLSGPDYETKKLSQAARSKDRQGPGKLPVPSWRVPEGFEPATARKASP